MKVVHIPFCFHPDPVGGTEVYVESLARETQTRGLSVVVAAPGSQSCRYEHRGLEVRRFAVPDRIDDLRELYGEGDAAAARELGKILDDECPDIVHLHAFTRGVSLRLMREAKARGIGVVFTYHTPTVSCQRGTLLRWGRDVCDGTLDRAACSECTLHGLGLAKIVSRMVGRIPPAVGHALGRAGASGGGWTALRMTALVEHRHAAVRALLEEVDEIVALCQWVHDLLVRNGVPARKIHLSRHGVPLPRPSKAEPLPDSRPTRLRVAFLGRLDRTKGPDILIRAVGALPGLPVEADLYGVAQSGTGDGYVRELRRLAQGDSRIRLLPPIPHDRLGMVLSAYDFVAVPSRWLETGPLVVLEAFAAGVPIIGSRLGGIAELVRDGMDGILIEADSVGAWSATLQRFCDDRGLVEHLRRSIRHPRTMDDVADDMVALYHRLLARQNVERCTAG